MSNNRKKRHTKINKSLELHKGATPMSTEDIEKTAVKTPGGVYAYNRMPFGLVNAASTFQRLMDHVLRDLPFVIAYIDDIAVFQTHSKNMWIT